MCGNPGALYFDLNFWSKCVVFLFYLVCLTALQNLNQITKKEVLKNLGLYRMMRYIYTYMAAQTKDRMALIFSTTNSPTDQPSFWFIKKYWFCDWMTFQLLLCMYSSLQKGTTHVPAKAPVVSSNNNSSVQLPPALMSLLSSASSTAGLLRNLLLFHS